MGEDQEVEGYHVFVGGGFGERRELARELLRDVPAEILPATIERLLVAYVARRSSREETFQDFAKRHSLDALRSFAAAPLSEAA